MANKSARLPENVACTLTNYAEHLKPGILFTRRFGSFFLQPPAVSGFRRGDCVFHSQVAERLSSLRAFTSQEQELAGQRV